MLKICLLQFPTERRLLQFRVQRAENDDLEIGDYPVEKVVYGKKVYYPITIPLLTISVIIPSSSSFHPKTAKKSNYQNNCYLPETPFY